MAQAGLVEEKLKQTSFAKQKITLLLQLADRDIIMTKSNRYIRTEDVDNFHWVLTSNTVLKYTTDLRKCINTVKTYSATNKE